MIVTMSCDDSNMTLHLGHLEILTYTVIIRAFLHTLQITVSGWAFSEWQQDDVLSLVTDFCCRVFRLPGAPTVTTGFLHRICLRHHVISLHLFSIFFTPCAVSPCTCRFCCCWNVVRSSAREIKETRLEVTDATVNLRCISLELIIRICDGQKTQIWAVIYCRHLWL